MTRFYDTIQDVKDNFTKAIRNDSSKAGQAASKKCRFGEDGRYAVWPCHTRFDEIEWFVADAYHPNSTMNLAEIIRQEPTLDRALKGLVQD